MNQFIDTYTESKYNYGLFMSNKLIQIMSIDIDSICRITNLCPHTYNAGVEYLFDYIRKTHNPTRIIGSCDFNLYDGSLYESLGFTFTKYSDIEERQILESNKTILYGSGYKFYEWN